MNYKTVLLLIKANQKSYRTTQNAKMRHFHENKLFTCLWYVLSGVIGVLGGYLIGNIYTRADTALQITILEGAGYVLVAMPTIALLYGLFFTQINQTQRMATKASAQAIYWFPISWQEHTLASIITSLIGTPLVITILISSAVLTASVFLGLVPFAALMVLALLASLLLISGTVEITKTVQLRLVGAITKTSGKTAIWLRFISMLGFMLLGYLVYFSVFNRASPIFLFEAIVGGQGMVWFIPYMWPGMLLSAFVNSLWVEAGFFSLATAIFVVGIFFAATYTNTRFGLYELPAPRLSGNYRPKPSLFEKIGFSSIEAALMKKDFKTLTRRPELIILFGLPIIVFAPAFSVVLMSAQSNASASMASYTIMFALIALGPGWFIAGRVGNILTGLEGRSMWYMFSAPISAKIFAKSKIAFTVFLSLAVTLICGVVGGIMFRPSPLIAGVILFEAIFLIIPVSAVSVAVGIKGADFSRDFPYCLKRRASWIHALLSFGVSLAVVAPIIPYGLSVLFADAINPDLLGLVLLPDYYVYLGLFVSGVIATGISYVFCRITVENAEQTLANAEVN